MPLQLEKKVMTEEEVAKLWDTFKVFDADGSGGISAEELAQVMRELGQNPSDTELRDMIKEVDVDLSGTIDFEEFKTLMVSAQGDRKSRLKLAFSVFDEDGSGHITTKELHNVMSQFGLTDKELSEMIKEVDSDGDASIDFEEFMKLVPEESEITTGYKDLPISFTSSSGNNTATVTTEVPAATDKAILSTTESPQQENKSHNPEVARLKELLAQHPQEQKERATSRLQMQIGLFRLIQGAAYRCFRESFSANHETHLRVRDLPYRITDFVPFVQKAIALYKGLDIAEKACYPLLDAVIESIEKEYSRLQQRIKNWNTIEKTPEMLVREKAMQEARRKSTSVKEKFAAGVEFAITLKKKHFSFHDIAQGVLAINELNRLRQMELNAEFAPTSPKSAGDPKDYLKQWNRVILKDASEEIDGAMMPVAYWYEDTKTAGEFDRYGADVAENFSKCTPFQKLAVKQAWRLTHHYLNGVQKRRERKEAGRESGALSQYVAFLDVYLERSDIKDAGMRVSFPYYIGPAVWRFFHTTAEILCTKPYEEQKALVAVFQDFFKLFATMYPCPYCRHHLNMYVVQNKEVDMYPVEYLLLGRDPKLNNFEVSMEAKLSTVVDGASLRLFFWKLHNTVSSSIARSEEWYHKDEKAFYTTRYWPSLDSELARSKALKHLSISVDRLYRLYGLLKPASRLAGVRANLQNLLDKGDESEISEACKLAENYIKELESSAISGEFLQETYRFDPEIVDQSPHFSPEEEEFARSGVFVEVV